METPFNYDGHGINDATGTRLFTGQRQHKDSGGGYVLDNQERERVGKLFAAAPDLLAALELAERYINPSHDGPIPNQAEMLADIRAALAKAKG